MSKKVGENMRQSIDTVQLGAAISAVGTILSAIAATPNQSIPDTIQDDFEFIGNILEALGTAVASEEDATALIRTGEILEIIGNIEVAASTLTDNRKLQKLLNKQGGLLQIVGGAVTLPYGEQLSRNEVIATIGSILDIIGNTIQVLVDDTTEQGIMWNAIGGWIQAVGAVIVVIAVEN